MWSPSPEKIASSTSILSVAASLVASAFLFRSMAKDLLPDGVYRCFQKLLNRLSPQLTVVVEEFDGIAANQMFESANTYLGSKLTYSVQKIKVHKPLKEANLIVSMDKNQEFYDSYEGVTFKWILISTSDDSPISNTGRRRDQSLVTVVPTTGVPSISITRPHLIPSPWNLLYGPPGTGKSSLIAAMANHLKFDVYDLDLREVEGNSDLRRLLIGTGSRSILVIEDIDCSIELQNRETDDKATDGDDEKVTLSGLLNFMDGLWTSCGDERIVICTTNHKDRLDPALLRPGRMDVHIHLSYCSFSGFKTLAANYLQVEEHSLFDNVEELLHKVEVTPAEVAGELMRSADADNALKGLVNFLQRKLPQGLH